MPLKKKAVMDQRVEFISEWRTGKHTITELCKSFEISRPSRFKMMKRFENLGFEVLKSNNISHQNHPNKTSDKVEKYIFDLKEKYPRWGAKKIMVLLLNHCNEDEIPSAVTVHNILKKNGLVKPQKRHKRVKLLYPIFDLKRCNEIWSADYKRKFFLFSTKFNNF
jgi:hypothetical protein